MEGGWTGGGKHEEGEGYGGTAIRRPRAEFVVAAVAEMAVVRAKVEVVVGRTEVVAASRRDAWADVRGMLLT